MEVVPRPRGPDLRVDSVMANPAALWQIDAPAHAHMLLGFLVFGEARHILQGTGPSPDWQLASAPSSITHTASDVQGHWQHREVTPKVCNHTPTAPAGPWLP